MAKCLVTKLKQAVNNPNLPIFVRETMQQFTLDAITASGNSGMTDEQKAALNHFFYQIGVFEADPSNTIWGKTKYLFMPIICNKVKAKTLVDYKDDGFNTYSLDSDVSDNITFDNYSCVSTISGVTRKTVVIDSAETHNASDLFVAVGYCANPSGNVGAFRVNNSIVYGESIEGTGNTLYAVLCNGVKKRFTIANVPYNRGLVISTKNGVYDALIIGTTENYSESTETGTENVPTTPYSLAVQFSPSPAGIIMLGSSLSSDEMTTLAVAIRELVAAM